ncbi:hypothetical protein EJB05_28067, partial [Eragrostis curvula]
MASNDAWNDLHVRVLSRRLVKASDSTIKPHVFTVSNLDLTARIIQTSMFCIYPKPSDGGDFDAVVAAFEAALPSFLNHFFPLAGRIIVANNKSPSSGAGASAGVPEIHCNNHGAELVVGEARGDGAAALASLDYSKPGASLLQRVQVPYGEDVALSVQVVSFACGGFTVAWRTNHVVLDGCAMSALVTAWSEFARAGKLAAAGGRPSFDRSAVVFRPRAPPPSPACVAASLLDKVFTPLDARRQVNVLTADQSSVLRFYYVDASDIARLRAAASRRGTSECVATRVEAFSAYLWKTLASVVHGTAETHCRMGWWVNGRRRLTATAPQLSDNNYFGNVIAFTGREASVEEVLQMPLPDVAAMVRDTITAPDYDTLFRGMVDWMEERKQNKKKNERCVLTAAVGLGSPTVVVTSFTSFRVDTDFGFGSAAMAVPTTVRTARLCSGFVQIIEKPGGDGSWIVSAFVWPRLAAALESDEQRVFKPLTAEHLGLLAPQVLRTRL